VHVAEESWVWRLASSVFSTFSTGGNAVGHGEVVARRGFLSINKFPHNFRQHSLLCHFAYNRTEARDVRTQQKSSVIVITGFLVKGWHQVVHQSLKRQGYQLSFELRLEP